jgi:D-alanine-D-alanine ligase
MDIALIERYRHKKVGVLLGGMSSEREISLRSGENVYQGLKKLNLNVVKIDVDRKVCQKIAREKIDVAFIALHGRYGEDGSIQGLLEVMGVPYTGPGILGSSLCMDKKAAKKMLESIQILTPPSVYFEGISLPEIKAQIKTKLGFPAVLKPNSEGSSIGVILVKDEEALNKALPDYTCEYPDSFAEKYIAGREITVGVLGDKKGISILPILELKPKAEFYDFKVKYTKGMTEFVIPAKIKKEQEQSILDSCSVIFREFGLNGGVRIDAILDSEDRPCFLEVNAVPGMTDTSDLPAMAKAAGMNFEELLIRILECSENRE